MPRAPRVPRPSPAPRARDLGVPFEGTPGPRNAITDVRGVEVGHCTLIRGHGALRIGRGPVRTGVTVLFPRGKSRVLDPVFGGYFSLNGNGEMTGNHWLEESGFLEGPVALTNTHSVGIVHDAVIEWLLKRKGTAQRWFMPVVAETFDGRLNDINGFHVRREHVFQALDRAAAGPLAEGNVGGGTGMICHKFKGGIGTASRRLERAQGAYTAGVLVQANYGKRRVLQIAGVPVGREIPPAKGTFAYEEEAGSIVIVVATDAPLLAHQCKRLARRAALGLARLGSIAGNTSGDIFLAFSTANPGAARRRGLRRLNMLPNEALDPLFEAVAQAVEEAIVNALVAARTLSGINGNTIEALPHARLREVLRKYNRLAL